MNIILSDRALSILRDILEEKLESVHSILVIEDETKLARSLSHQLEEHGFHATVIRDGVKARQFLEKNRVCLLLLDLNLPGIGGWEILKWMKESGREEPVIIISAAQGVDDRIRALRAGADDFLVKPFDSGELLARVSAVLRRVEAPRVSVLAAGDLEMNVTEHTVIRGGEKIELSKREFALLEFLLRNKNQVLTRQRLMQQVWGYDFETQTNIVDVYMSYLRKAIDNRFQLKLIRTIHGEGFMLSDEEN